MKLLIVLSVYVASILAVPHLEPDFISKYKNGRFINELIISAIEQLKQDIVDEGYDPYFAEKESASYALPVPVIFNANGLVEDFLLQGLSNIDIVHIDYTVLSSRLEFDLFMPLIDASLKTAQGEVVIFGNEYKGVASGRFSVSDIRIAGQLSVSLLGGISLSELNLDCSIGAIKSDLNVVIFGRDVSQDLNRFLEVNVVNKLTQFKAEVNELLDYYLIDLINDVLAEADTRNVSHF